MQDSKILFTITFTFGVISVAIPTIVGCVEQTELKKCNVTISELVSSKISSFVFAVMFIIFWFLVLKLLLLYARHVGVSVFVCSASSSKKKENKNVKNLLLCGYLCVALGVFFGALQTLDMTLHYILAGTLFFAMFLLFEKILSVCDSKLDEHKLKITIARLLLFISFFGMILTFIIDDLDHTKNVYIFEWMFVGLLFSYPLIFHRFFFDELNECSDDVSDARHIISELENNNSLFSEMIKF